jgi:porin
MMKKTVTVIVACVVFSVVSAWAQETATQTEIDSLKQRVAELEQKQDGSGDGGAESSGWVDYITIGGVLSGAYQFEWADGPPEVEDRDRGALSFQPEVGITPTESDEIFFLLGFGAGNGLSGVTAFNLAPWAAGVEDDVKDINGRSRDYLLQAWYKHTFTIGEEHTLGLVGGIIDATAYLDDNAYANDEYAQFMNEALVNGPNAFLPSWDFGAAAEWDIGPFGLRGVFMNIGENDDGNNYNFYGVQMSYTLATAMGEGTYRVNYNVTSEAFLDPQGEVQEPRNVLLFSFDQALGDIFGTWVRLGFQTDDALITYDNLYSGGINISGSLWGREQDNLGIGYAFLEGAQQTGESIDTSQVAEAYVNFGLNDYLALTFDVQYMQDTYTIAESDVDGWIAGLRATVEF